MNREQRGAKRVGPTGLAFGLDMTDEMLALAQRNTQDAGGGRAGSEPRLLLSEESGVGRAVC